MSRYLPLLRVEVRHDFHGDAPVPRLRFEPVPHSRALLQRLDGLVRATPDGFVLLADADRLPVEADDDHAVAGGLSWWLHADDPGFFNVTAGLGPAPDGLWWFRGAEARFDADTGTWRLHDEERAGRADVHPASGAGLAAWCGGPARLPSPVALLSLPLARRLTPAADAPVVYRLHLAARATVWRYCFVGDWHDAPLRVVDLVREARFEPPEPLRLADGRPALAVRSSAPLALSRLAVQRFQLRTPDASGKVLVKRLPVASPHHFAREPIDGVPTLVSDIFVHR